MKTTRHTIYALLLIAAPLLTAPHSARARQTAVQTTAEAQQATGEPQFLETLKPDERTHDFGRIREADGKVSHVFRLKNNGSQPVAISAINTWCGCMAADYTKRAIRPGETGEVTVTLDPDHKQGNFVKQVVVLLGGGSQYVRLWVKADITPMDHPITDDCPYNIGSGLYANLQYMPFPDLQKGERYGYNLRLGNSTDRPMTVTFSRNPNNTVLKMPAEVKLKPRERKTIRVEYTYPRRHTRVCYVDLVPTVNGQRTRPIRVQWNAGRKFKLNL